MFNIFKKKKHRESLKDDNPNFEERYISKLEINPEGGELMHVMGEKYPIRGNPKKIVLMALEPIKSIIDKIIVGRLSSIIPFSISNEKLSPPVQELARIFDLLIEAEKLEGSKKKWKAYKKVFCTFFENDLPYRYKLQWALERLNIDKIKLTDADKYFFRVKNFWVDLEEENAEALRIVGKDKFPEFKEWISRETNWEKGNTATITMEELAKQFINNKKL